MPINWQDGAAGGTPLSAANLNRLAVIADLGAAGTPTGDAVKAAAAAVAKSADTITDGTTNKAYTATEKTKLAGVAAGATAYTDAMAQAANASALTAGLAAKADLVSGAVPDAQLPARLADASLSAAFDAKGLRFDARDYAAGGVINAAAINAAITAAGKPGVFGEVVLPPGLIQLESAIILQQGVHLTGSGGHDSASRPATEFQPAAGYTGVAFSFPYDGANLWHHGGLRRFRVKNFASHGVHILGGLGELSVIDEITCQANGGDGIRIEGPSTPAMIGRVGVYSNTGAGLRLVNQNQTHTQILYLAGDNNGESLMTVDKLDATASVQVVSWKGERWNRAPLPFGHPNIFVMNDGNGGLLDIGEGRVNVGTGATAGTAVVQQNAPTGSVGRVTMRFALNDFSGTGGYTYGYQDTKNAVSYTVAQSSRRRLLVSEPITPVSTTTSYTQLIGDINGIAVYAGTVNPNSNVTAPPGSIYIRQNSTSDGRIYKKTGGTGSTTWEEMLSTDTGTVDTKTAPAAGNAAALPATPNGYMTVMVQGVARKIAYY